MTVHPLDARSARKLAELHAAAVPAKPETVAQRIQRLQREAREMAAEHISAVLADLESAATQAREIAAGGAAYPDGVQQQLDQLAREVESRLQSIRAIVSRTL